MHILVCMCVWGGHKCMKVRRQLSGVRSVFHLVRSSSLSFFFLWYLACFRLWAQKHIPQSHLLSWNRNAGITDVHHHIWLLIWALGSKLRLWSSVASMFTHWTIHSPDHGGPILNESLRQFLWVLECVILYAFCKSRTIQSCWSGISIRADKKYLSKSILFFFYL